MTPLSTTQKITTVIAGLAEKSTDSITITEAECIYWWNLVNDTAFDSSLNPPTFIIKGFYKNTFGWCKPIGRLAKSPDDRLVKIGINSKIKNTNILLNILIHEMVHQWEYQILGEWDDSIAHGKNFYSWREPLHELFGVTIQKSYSY